MLMSGAVKQRVAWTIVILYDVLEHLAVMVSQAGLQSSAVIPMISPGNTETPQTGTPRVC